MPGTAQQQQKLPVLLYVPNLLGYARIILAFVGLHYSFGRPVTAVVTWVASACLDLLDGILAKVLCQTSQFGVFLDICADNVLRTAVWLAVTNTANGAASSSSEEKGLLPHSSVVSCVALFIICLEWTTMVSTQVHAAAGSSNSEHWKEARERDPWIVRVFFRNNFRNVLGSLGIYGLFSANLFAYGSYHPVLYDNIPFYNALMYLAFIGRALSMAIEIWFCCSYFSCILENDNQARQQQQQTNGVSQKSR